MLGFVAIMFNTASNTPRTNFYLLLTEFTISFAVLVYLMRQQISWKHILGLGIIVRLFMLWTLPELSNDFYRFLWDGELLLQGVNPFAHTPKELIPHGQFFSNAYYRELYDGMGELSASNYSCYPVVNQLFFLIGALFSDSIFINVIVLKLLIIAADIMTFWIAVKILDILDIERSKIGWYFLNPLILLEFTGNLHFEGVMISFILLCFYYILKHQWFPAAIFLGLAVQVKLIPLMFIPFFYKKLKFRKSLGFTALTALVVILTSQILITPDNFGNFMASVQLYFDNFQFNASIFDWINQLYSSHIGRNTTQIIGPILAKTALAFIILLVLLRADHKPNDFIKGILFALVIYYAFATTVHPWYISLILMFSIFTNYTFGIVWSGLIIVSYLAYSHPDFKENTVLNTIAYLLIYGVLMYEIFKHWSRNSIGLQINDFFGFGQSRKV